MVKTLTVTEEAYERLASRKEPGESFTDVINKITGKASLLDLVGVLTNKEADALEKRIKDTRKAMNERVKRTASELNDTGH